MTIVINPKYSSLRPFIEKIPNKFDTDGEMVYEARNQLKKFSANEYEVIVKRYKKPHYINRIAYTFLRPSKAKRAYEYALKLLELSVNTSAPVAYIEQKSCGLLNYGYFISIYEKDFSDIRDLMTGKLNDDVLLQQLSTYIAYFHNKGVLHLDMSPGNILYKKIESNYQFTLIDINRMQFMPTISKIRRFKSFKRLSENKAVLTSIAKAYATAAQLDEYESVEKINHYCTEF